MRKTAVSLLTWAAVYWGAAGELAMASPWQHWLSWRRPKESCAANVSNTLARRIFDESQKEFAAYLEMRRKSGQKIPVTSTPIRPETSLHEIFYGFTFWWVPGNVWHSLLIKDQPQLGAFMLLDAQSEGIEIPDISHKPEVAESFTIPDSI